MLISYTPGTLQSIDGDAVAAVSNLVVSTATINTFAIPGQVEAEAFETNSGWTAETCTDDGGGYDMGYTDAGDYLDYRVEVAQAGRYRFDFRLSSGNSGGGKADFQLLTTSGPSTLTSFLIPYTGGWQTWVTQSQEAILPAGIQTLRLLVNKKEFNLNWMKAELLTATATTDLDGHAAGFAVYPNPARSRVWVEYPEPETDQVRVRILTIQGMPVTDRLMTGGKTGLDVSALKAGCYIVQVIDRNRIASQSMIILN